MDRLLRAYGSFVESIITADFIFSFLSWQQFGFCPEGLTIARWYKKIEHLSKTSAATNPGRQPRTAALIGPEQSEFGQWLPASLTFASASNSGPPRKRQIIMLSKSIT